MLLGIKKILTRQEIIANIINIRINNKFRNHYMNMDGQKWIKKPEKAFFAAFFPDIPKQLQGESLLLVFDDKKW